MKSKRNRGASAFEEAEVIDFEQARRERREKRRQKLEKLNPPELDPQELKRNAKRRRFVVFSTAVILFLGAVIVSAGVKLWNLHLEKQEVLAQIEALTQKQAELENELLQLDDDEYIEQKARSELHMIFPGETMYVVLPDNPDAAGGEGGETEDN